MRFDYGKLRPRIEKLDNGIPLYLFPDSVELVRLEFIFDAGSFFQKKPLQAGACCSLIGAGTERYTADKLSEEMDFYGAYTERYSDRDQACITFFSPTRHFDKIIPFCEEALKHSVFPESETETYLRKQHHRFDVNSARVAEVARRAFYPMVFGDEHPYGVVLHAEDFSALKAEDIREFYAQFYHAGNCSIVLAGSFTAAHIAALNRAFGQDGRRGGKASSGVTPPPLQGSAERMKEISMEGSLQQAVMVGMPIFPFTDPDFAPFKVVDYVLGGYFGSRLMRNIREDKGYTYGISSYTVPLRYMPVWAISSEVKAGCADKVLTEIRKEIDKLCRKEIDRKELELVRNAYMGEFMQDLDGTFDIAERMKFFLQAGIGPELYERQEEVLFSVTPAEIRAYAQRFLVWENFRTIVVGEKQVL